MSLKSLISLGGPIVPVAPGSLGHPVDPVPTVFEQEKNERRNRCGQHTEGRVRKHAKGQTSVIPHPWHFGKTVSRSTFWETESVWRGTYLNRVDSKGHL